MRTYGELLLKPKSSKRAVPTITDDDAHRYVRHDGLYPQAWGTQLLLQLINLALLGYNKPVQLFQQVLGKADIHLNLLEAGIIWS